MLFPTCEVRVVGFYQSSSQKDLLLFPSFPSCKCLIAVGATGPQPQVPDRSGHYRSSTQNTQSHNIEMSWWGSLEVKLYVWCPTSLAKGPAKGLSKQMYIDISPMKWGGHPPGLDVLCINFWGLDPPHFIENCFQDGE